MSSDFPHRGTPFAESEAFMAALTRDEEEVELRVEQMLPGERQDLADACHLLAQRCLEANHPALKLARASMDRAHRQQGGGQ